MKYTVKYTSQFKKDLKLSKKPIEEYNLIKDRAVIMTMRSFTIK